MKPHLRPLPRIIIRGVPQRRPWIDYLRRHLPSAIVCMDADRNAMHTFEAALVMAGAEAALHMEDDTVLTRGFGPKVAAVLAERPDVVVQFFSRRKEDAAGPHWGSSFIYGQCFYTPAGVSMALLEFLPGWQAAHPEHPTGLDYAVNDFLRSRKQRCWVHVPSLVQHREGVSAIDPRRARRRQSKTFVEPLE